MDSSAIQADRGYSKAFAAEALTVCVKTLEKQIKDGKIKAVPVSARRKAIRGSEIIRILQGQAVA